MEPKSDHGTASIDEAIRPVVIVLGDFSHEGLTAKIEALGFEVINRRLRSGPNNWLRISELMRSLIEQGRLALVFAYVPTATLLLMVEAQYDEIRGVLLEQIQRARGTFFVYEKNVQGVIEPLPWEIEEEDEDIDYEENSQLASVDDPRYSYTREGWLEENSEGIERATKFLHEISHRGLEIVPFRKRSDVTLRMFQLLEEAQAGIFLRLYVPNGRYQGEQFEDFLTMFSRYLRDVEGKQFSIDIHRAARGTTYIFRGKGDSSNLDSLREATGRFDSFLSLAVNDPEAAAVALTNIGIPGSDAGFVVAKYARGLRRLNMEIRHDFDRRKLLLSQTLESELLDINDSILLPMPSDSHPSTLFSVVGNTAPVTINLPNSIVIGGIMQLIEGDLKYTPEDRQIMNLIESLEDKVKALGLKSELDRLKDEATPPEERRTAVQKLKSFLYTGTKYFGSKIDEIGTGVLIAYLEKNILGG